MLPFSSPNHLLCITGVYINHLPSIFEDISAVACTFKLPGLRKLSVVYRVHMLVSEERANRPYAIPVTLDDLDMDCLHADIVFSLELV